MWVGRRQAQNAADAGALAGAVSMAFDANGWTDRTVTGPARTSARQTGADQLRMRTGAGRGHGERRVSSPTTPAAMCPADANGNTPCIRVDVYRNQARGNPLPAIFGAGVRAAARRAFERRRRREWPIADASDCLKPWAIPDKWIDIYDVTAPTDTRRQRGREDDSFDARAAKRQRRPPLANPDVYTPPSPTSPGTGFTVAPPIARGDLGRRMVLKTGSPQTRSRRASSFPFGCRAMTAAAPAATTTDENIATCTGLPVEIGDTLDERERQHDRPDHAGRQRSDRAGSQRQWDPTTNSVTSSCAQRRRRAAAQVRASCQSRSSTPRRTTPAKRRGYRSSRS